MSDKTQKLCEVKNFKKLEIKRKNYNDYLNKGNIRALLKLLKSFEDQGEFEECKVIKDVIDTYNELCNEKLPTRL